MNFSSKILEDAVNEMSQLPGVGKRTALRFVLHLMRQPEQQTDQLSTALTRMRHDLKFCKKCHNVSDGDLCEICSSPKRDETIVCVVEDIRDVMAIENTSQYRGLYHVLGGKISPMDGIGPQDLKVRSLVERIKKDGVQEIIFALSPTIEGDTTNFYIFKQLEGIDIRTSTIARGIAVGDELEFADEVTLGRSIAQRVPYESSIKN
ncbi:recombination protein RecR [Nonlabens spongiae]|uniref:Recombination protein RecR n=1 Tax=Nonlabens spongiae TaxID=331648 RepID=A0A1W6MJC2_9FLAO|nr:recombination mediator RecR [Nonlabens spongiae]ARN77682.1 recombination protein RecR [Nonlabens spongiae]